MNDMVEYYKYCFSLATRKMHIGHMDQLCRSFRTNSHIGHFNFDEEFGLRYWKQTGRINKIPYNTDITVPLDRLIFNND